MAELVWERAFNSSTCPSNTRTTIASMVAPQLESLRLVKVAGSLQLLQGIALPAGVQLLIGPQSSAEVARLKPKKPGRNDLCVCGSMRKWKQCCGLALAE